MKEGDLETLYAAYLLLSDLLREEASRRPRDGGLVSARAELELSFHLRLYALFESILAHRSKGKDIASYVQWEVGVTTLLDPAPPHDRIRWWELLQRDRNILAHGMMNPPALSLASTLDLFRRYLALDEDERRRLKQAGTRRLGRSRGQ